MEDYELDKTNSTPKAALNRKQNDAEWPDWKIWRRAVRDVRISHPAFRLWHYYRDSMGQNGSVSGYFAHTKIAAQYLNSKEVYITRWNLELQQAGWLAWRVLGQNHEHVYTVLDGLGKPCPFKAQRETQAELPYGPAVLISRTSLLGGARQTNGTARASLLGGADNYNSHDLRSQTPPRPREAWEINKELATINALWMEAMRMPDGEDKKATLQGLRNRRRKLAMEMAGAQPSEVGPTDPPPQQQPFLIPPKPPDAPGPKPEDQDYHQWKKQIFG